MSKTSVVLTTYNGSKFIIPQLESLKKQTLPPEEVLIFDDRSSDDTVEIVSEYILNNHLDWKLFVNERRYGWRYNFMQGFQKSSGLYIFPCDQDDIWHFNKIELMHEVMEINPQVELLATNYEYRFDPSYKGKLYKKAFNNNYSIEKISERNMQRILRPGCTFCFRKDLFLRALPYWKDGFAHDSWLWRCAIAENSAYLFNFPSIIFRRHESNASHQTVVCRADFMNMNFKFYETFQQLNKFSIDYSHNFAIKYSESLAKFYYAKYQIFDRVTIKRLIALLKLIKYYQSIKEILIDVKFLIFG